MREAGLLDSLNPAADAIRKVSDLLKILENIKGWIIVQPKEAAAELSNILNEVMKATPATTLAIDELFKIIDDKNPNLTQLSAVATGDLALRIHSLRPHCGDIKLIAEKYLYQLLQRPDVKGEGALELRHFLEEIAENDVDYFRGLDSLASAIQTIAAEAFKLSAEGERDQALKVLAAAAPKLFEIRKSAIQMALRLTNLQIEFRSRALGI